MKITTILLIYFFTVNACAAQVNDNMFIGAVTVKGGTTYPYKIQFSDSNDKIKGYSITDINGPDETKTAISGTIDRRKNELRFMETHIISTKSTVSNADFCFISAKLKLSEKRDTKLMRGHFTGFKPGGKDICGKGSIMLVCTEDFLAKLMPMIDTLDTAQQKLIKSKIKEFTAEKEIPDPNRVRYIQPGGTEELILNARNIEIEFWDNEKIDGDILSISLNDKVIVDHYNLVAEHKKINFTLSGEGSSTLTITANGEGAEPPNTIRMTVNDGERTYQIQASTTLSKNVKLILKNNQ